MYIVAIGWAYVILMMAITASSIGKGISIFVFLGVLPLTLFVYAAGRPQRRSVSGSEEISSQTDAADTQPDQR